MGSIITKSNSCCNELYENYYPKHKWLHPLYVTSFGTLALVGSQLIAKEGVRASVKLNHLYLVGLSGAFGIQLWTTFVTGPTMLRVLPRQNFGALQAQLFPRYFCTITLFSGLSAYAFLKRFPFSNWDEDVTHLGFFVLESFILNFINSTCFGKQSLIHMEKMYEIEQQAGIGQNHTALEHIKELDENKEYKFQKSKFGLMHGLSMFANFGSLVATGVQLYLLAHKGFFEI